MDLAENPQSAVQGIQDLLLVPPLAVFRAPDGYRPHEHGTDSAAQAIGRHADLEWKDLFGRDAHGRVVVRRE